MTSPALERSCPSELFLDRLFVGELDDAAVRAHVESCTRCTARVDERKALSATFASDVGLDVRVAATARALGSKRSWRVAASVAGAAAAAAVVFVVSPRGPDAPAAIEESEAPTVRRKGGVSMGLVARHLDGRIETLTSPAELAPGEAIQFQISTGSSGFLGIVGVDSAQVVTPYAPAHLGPALPVAAGRDQLLDGSIVLDETLGPERIFAILCKDELSMETIVAGARSALTRAGSNPAQLDVLPVPEACVQTSFLIEKKRR